MTLELNFMSHLRLGLSRLIGSTADTSGLPQADSGTLTIDLDTGGTPISRSFTVAGPDAVTGLAAGEILRTEPPANTRDHPPNLFPAVELQSEDLPWRYTLAQANGEKLAPWLVLAVVPERAGISLETLPDMTVLTVDDVAELPDLGEAWAWAHVQVASDEEDLDALRASSPEALWSRLLCPRHLEPDTDYLACIVPTFEAGRLAGLGLSTQAASAGELAWHAASDVVTLPVYFHWRFRTASSGADFEELVRRLTPIELAPEVGMHPLDLSDPGSGRLPQGDVQLGFLGALVSPEVVDPPWREPHRGHFEAAMHELLADATPGQPLAPGEDYDPLLHDPVVAPPRYGLLPSGLDDIPLPQSWPSPHTPKWLADANLDPRHRAVAGVGAEVVRRNQERLMAAAWAQADGITHVNRLLNDSRLALEVGRRQHLCVATLAEPSVLQVTRGAHARLSGGAGSTVFGAVVGSDLPGGSISAAFRRQLRVGGLFAKALRSTPGAGVGVLVSMTDRIATQTSLVLRYADLTVPYGTWMTADEETDGGNIVVGGIELRPLDITLDPAGRQVRADDLLQRLRGNRSAASRRLERRLQRTTRTTPLRQPRLGGTRRVFQVGDPEAFSRSLLAGSNLVFETRPVDSVFAPIEHTLSDAGNVSDGVTPLDVATLSADITAQLEPTDALAARLRHVIEPATVLGTEPVPAAIGVAPAIDDALYADVVRIDPELMMPGVGELPGDSVGLAATNQSYVEAFLLGANDAFASELLWREYPTDLSGTWLRTFWDRAGVATADAGDIPVVADWGHFRLGTHPAAGVDPERTVVLVVKGELLLRYPNTLVSAVPARWREDDGAELREEDTDADTLLPAFSGRLGADVVFLGFQFDASVDVQRDVVGSSDPDDGRPGWYFAFEQPPTEPAFGLDTAESDEDSGLDYWKDLTWADARQDDGATHVQLAALDLTLPYDRLGDNQWTETWADSAAAMARITLQRPVRMLVHADQMLPPAEESS